MMFLLYDDLPCSAVVGNEEYAVITDFREWIRLIDMLNSDLNATEKASLCKDWFCGSCPKNVEDIIKGLCYFLKCGEDVPESDDQDIDGSEKVVFSYSYDADAILSGFMQAYRIDLVNIDYMHWWHFKLLLNGLPEDTEFKRRVYYRGINLADIKDDNERKRIAKIKKQIALPAEMMSDEDIGNAFW